MRKIETIDQLNALIGQTYMYAVIGAIVALVVAFAIAKLILFQGGKNDRSHITRRIWFVVIGLIAPISFFMYNAFIVSDKITKSVLVDKFSNVNIVATLMILGIYVVVGIVSMILFRSSQWGSILGKTK